MPTINAIPIRLELTIRSNPPVPPLDANTGAMPQFWRGSDTAMAFAVFDASGVAVDLSNFIFLEADLSDSPSSYCPILVSETIGAADIEPTVTLEAWRNGTSQQGIFIFPAADTASLCVTTQPFGRNFWLAIHGVTSQGNNVAIAGGWARVFPGVVQEINLPPNSSIPLDPTDEFSIVPANLNYAVGCSNTNFYTSPLHVDGLLEVCGVLIES